MATTPYTKYRLSSATLDQLDALAVSAGSRSQALREAVAGWHAAVLAAARRNVAELTPIDWSRLALLNQLDAEEEEVDWSARIARELKDIWEDSSMLPHHEVEAIACYNLAVQIQRWEPVRGYALFAALRHFWSLQHNDPEWYQPSVWMTPVEREE